MKSEHRHELQTNDLQKYASIAARYIDQHGNRLMTIISVAAVVLAIGIYYYRTQSNKTVNAQAELAMALNTGKPEVMQDVWDRYPGTVPGLWAKVHEGEIRLNEGVTASFRNLEKGLEDIKKAQDAFEVVVNDSKAPREIRERALFGLARAQESRSEGNEEDAFKTYELFVKEFPKSILKDDAESRLANLKSESGRDFYKWFASYTRPKIEEKRPRDKGTIDGDDELSNFKELGDFDLGKPRKKTKPSADEQEDLSIPDPSENKEKAPQLKEKPDFVDPDGAAEKPASPEAQPDSPAEPDAKPEAKSDDQPEAPAEPEPKPE